MSGFSAGLISIATFLVAASIVTVLVKNSSGSVGLVNAVAGGFSQVLTASQGGAGA